eukprot:m.641882 g.641882  ORF g.641882 m.641882 type:complete len:274 (-) comp22632_c0_seq7:419-1240(-)
MMKSVKLLTLLLVLAQEECTGIQRASYQSGTICSLHANVADGFSQDTLLSGRASGLLNGMNVSQPADSVIDRFNFTMWRGPMASWLWPNRTYCTGWRSCCTESSCAAPFAEASRILRIGGGLLRQQYILDSFHYGVGSCEWKSLHGTPLHNCSLPGGPTDPDFSHWEYTVRSAALGAQRAGVGDASFDVWNEPNALLKRECMAYDTCTFDTNLTQEAFFALYDRAHKASHGRFLRACSLSPPPHVAWREKSCSSSEQPSLHTNIVDVHPRLSC